MEHLLFYLLAVMFGTVALYLAAVMIASLVGTIIVTIRGRNL